jgi:hypothetical protein
MDITIKKLSLIHWLTELNDISIINRIENIRNMQSSSIKEPKTFTIEELINRHLQSENDIRKNNLINQDELVNYFDNKLNV